MLNTAGNLHTILWTNLNMKWRTSQKHLTSLSQNPVKQRCGMLYKLGEIKPLYGLAPLTYHAWTSIASVRRGLCKKGNRKNENGRAHVRALTLSSVTVHACNGRVSHIKQLHLTLVIAAVNTRHCLLFAPGGALKGLGSTASLSHFGTSQNSQSCGESAG